MNNAGDLAVYVHWPYCARICPYCDFNVYKRRADDTLLPAILDDLTYWRGLSGPRRVTSLHFGGGTPSLMTPNQVAAVIAKVAELWGDATPEIAIEANPHEANADSWRGYARAGVTRMSLGVQSFHDGALTFLGRDHDGAKARAALTLATDIFPSVSVDLIFGWAGQRAADLREDLDIVLTSGASHISTYQLTVEDGTAFAKSEARGHMRTVDPDLSATFYELVRDRLIGAGFDHYEVSNFAKSGHRSQHNLAYWQGQDYVGVGPGAHGRITTSKGKLATIAHLRPGAYTTAVNDDGHGIETTEVLSAEDQAAEYVMMGLRINDGVSMSHYRALTGEDLDVADLVADGLLIQTGERVAATPSGRFVLNAITAQLLAG